MFNAFTLYVGLGIRQSLQSVKNEW